MDMYHRQFVDVYHRLFVDIHHRQFVEHMEESVGDNLCSCMIVYD